jgi:hypothetical protein
MFATKQNSTKSLQIRIIMEWLGLKWVYIKVYSISGAFGSLLALWFNKNKLKELKKLEVIFVFLAGWGLSHWAGLGLIDHWKIDIYSPAADGIKLVIGLFGMVSVHEANIQIPLILAALRKRFIGE